MKQGGVFKSVALDFQDSLSDYLIIFSDAVRVRKTARAGRLDRSPIPRPKVPRLTGSMEALIDIYFDGVYHEGDKALPARVDDSDSEHSSEEFFFKHMNEPTDAELAEARATDPDFAEKMQGLVRKWKKAQQDHRQRYLKQFSKAYYAANKEVINARGKAHRKKCKEQKSKNTFTMEAKIL